MWLSRNTLSRQWQMLRLIPRYPQKITARDLQRRLAVENFEINKRTIERDLQTLSGVFPLTLDDRDKPYGWSWQKDAPSFDLPGLSATEALSLKLIERHLQSLLPRSIVDQLAPHFRTAEQKLNGLVGRHQFASWPNKIRVVPPTQPLRPPSTPATVQQTIYDALLQERQISAGYRKRGDKRPVQYTLHPLGIVQRGPVTYLVATVFDYPDPRLFALHRFQKAEMLDEPANVPKNFDLDAYIASGAFGFSDGGTIRLEAIFTDAAAEHLYETPLSSDQTLKPLGDGCTRLAATVADTAQLRWWLLGFGAGVEVKKPVALRRKMAAAAKAMAARYSSVR
jgi:predicted DNA-binding transcriptional regulator YafY